MVIVFGLFAALYQFPILSGAIGDIPDTAAVTASLPFLLGLTLLFVLPTTAMIFWSPSKIGTGVFGILILSELVVGVISAALLTDEAFSWREITGCALILCAGALEIVLPQKISITRSA